MKTVAVFQSPKHLRNSKKSPVFYSTGGNASVLPLFASRDLSECLSTSKMNSGSTTADEAVAGLLLPASSPLSIIALSPSVDKTR